MDLPKMCSDCIHYWISFCPHCDQVIGHCHLCNDLHPLGGCPDFKGGDE